MVTGWGFITITGVGGVVQRALNPQRVANDKTL